MHPAGSEGMVSKAVSVFLSWQVSFTHNILDYSLSARFIYHQCFREVICCVLALRFMCLIISERTGFYSRTLTQNHIQYKSCNASQQTGVILTLILTFLTFIESKELIYVHLQVEDMHKCFQMYANEASDFINILETGTNPLLASGVKYWDIFVVSIAVNSCSHLHHPLLMVNWLGIPA